MNFRDYQVSALLTEQSPKVEVFSEIVPLLGLAGEAGELLSEYKKYLRDGASHRLFKERVAEELGDLLWYIANVASKFDIDLDNVAEKNLLKCRERWGVPGAVAETNTYVFDAGFPEGECLPRQFIVDFTTIEDGGKTKMQAFVGDKPLGSKLTDNSYGGDGYRYHDVFHLTCAAILGWSPVIRKLLDCKRKSNPDVDEIEDGGRATAIEEGISALVFSYATKHSNLEGITSLDYTLLRTIKGMVEHLEVSVCTLRDWEQTILTAYQAWRTLENKNGGNVSVDLNARCLTYGTTDVCS